MDSTAQNDNGKNDELAFVYDVPVKLQVILGETTLSIRDVLRCNKGSVIPLNQKMGDPFDIILQKRKIAEGEIVEAGDHLGIKITKVVTGEPNAGSEKTE